MKNIIMTDELLDKLADLYLEACVRAGVTNVSFEQWMDGFDKDPIFKRSCLILIRGGGIANV